MTSQKPNPNQTNKPSSHHSHHSFFMSTDNNEQKASDSNSRLVAVTGASGYLAGELIAQLLERGYRVRGTVRSLANKAKVSHLQSWSNLELFEADLLEDNAFDKCFEDCEIVFHTASPFLFEKPDDPFKELIDPAVKGTKNVMASALKTKSVKRIVVTSSVAAVKRTDRPADHVFTEDDWNETSTVETGAYFVSKVRAEKAAWAMAKEANREQDLCVINPGFILGPPRSARTDSTSVRVCKALMEDGVVRPYHYVSVDVRDVAWTHIAAAESNESGRFLCVLPGSTIADTWASWMKEGLSASRKNKLAEPKRPPLDSFTNPQITMSSARAEERLGLQLRPLKTTMIDMANSLFDFGIVSE